MQLNRVGPHPNRHLTSSTQLAQRLLQFEKVYKRKTAMNLAMQLRRALITLGLAVVAIVCVAAKSATVADMHAQMPAFDTSPAASVTIAKEALDVKHIVTVLRDAVPVRMSKNQRTRKPVVVRCEAVTRG
jgi:hypothetical protein